MWRREPRELNTVVSHKWNGFSICRQNEWENILNRLHTRGPTAVQVQILLRIIGPIYYPSTCFSENYILYKLGCTEARKTVKLAFLGCAPAVCVQLLLAPIGPMTNLPTLLP